MRALTSNLNASRSGLANGKIRSPGLKASIPTAHNRAHTARFFCALRPLRGVNCRGASCPPSFRRYRSFNPAVHSTKGFESLLVVFNPTEANMAQTACANAQEQITKILDQYEAVGSHFMAFSAMDDPESLWQIFKLTNMTLAQAMGKLKDDIQALESLPCLLYTSPSPRD